MLWHEQTHARQRHSIDILIIQSLQVVLWFNPLLHITKRAIKLNHEFLADQGVLNKGAKVSFYQQLLLEFSSKKPKQQLASAINYSSIKKRFTVMKTQTSKSTMVLRSLVLLPLLAITLYGFSNTLVVEKTLSSVDNTILTKTNAGKTQQNSQKEASQELMEEYKAFIVTYKKTNVINHNKYERACVIYHNIMSDTQRKSVSKPPQEIVIPANDLENVQPKTPTKDTYNLWKNKVNYALWLDTKVIDNSKLNTLLYSDIEYYTSSFIHKNARSKKFPQAYQVSLFTKKGFNRAYKNVKINEYKALSKTYTKQLHQFLKGDRLDNSALKVLYYQGKRLYESISEQNKHAHQLNPLAPIPSAKSKKEIIKNGTLKTITKNKNSKTTVNTREEFLKKYDRYETLRYQKPHFIKKSKKDKKIMNDLWMELRQMLIYSLSKTDKKDLKFPISPLLPYVKILYDGTSYYKVSNKLTPEEIKSTFAFPYNPSEHNALDLLDDSDPITIPIGTYTLTEGELKKDNKRRITITVSEHGEYAISEDELYQRFTPISLSAIERMISAFSKKEIQNTFVFSKSKDLNTFRSKSAKTSGYQDSIEIKIIKTDVRYPVSEFKGKYYQRTSFQFALDNDNTTLLKPHVQQLAKIFRAQGITNITL